MFPDAAPLHLSRIQLALERAASRPITSRVCVRTTSTRSRAWIDRLDANREAAERLAGGERLRVWRLYLRAARNGFRTGFTSIYQVLGHRS